MINKNDIIYIAGGSSMLGKATIANLKSKGYTNLVYPTHEECDWLIYTEGYDSLNKYKPKYLINFLGFNGNINFNKTRAADIYMKSAYLALNVLAVGSTFCEKIVSILPSCAYSCDYTIEQSSPTTKRYIREILNEEDFLDGESHGTVAAHGHAKRILFDYSRNLHKQFSFNSVCCVLNNCFGPHDHYEDDNRLKVGGGMIQKFILAKRNNTDVNLFGTGKPLRELMYCKDAADGIAFVLEEYDDPMEVINIGPGHEISMRELSIMVKQAVGFEGNINWDTTKPDGQLRKLLSSDKIAELGWRPKYNNIEEAIVETVKWYEETYK